MDHEGKVNLQVENSIFPLVGKVLNKCAASHVQGEDVLKGVGNTLDQLLVGTGEEEDSLGTLSLLKTVPSSGPELKKGKSIKRAVSIGDILR